MDEKIQILKNWIDSSDNVVFFGGAGVSTESGIPDFRSVDGLYNQQWKYPPETILSHSFFVSKPDIFSSACVSSSGIKPPFCGSLPVFTSHRTSVTTPAFAERLSISSASKTESTLSIIATLPTRYLTLFF